MREYPPSRELRPARTRPRPERRNRKPALIILVIVAVIVIAAGLIGSAADKSDAPAATPFKVLPLAPANLGTANGEPTTTTPDESSTTTTSSGTSTTGTGTEGGDVGLLSDPATGSA